MIPIQPLTAFKDNYIWMFQEAGLAWVVDPGDATVVLQALQSRQMDLAGILLTHHHHDHSGGIPELLKNFPKAVVKSAANVTEHVEINCHPLRLKVLEIPGHTLDHLAFYNDDLVFCGDTLFSAGCGRVFEGTPNQMFHSLQKLVQLSDQTLVYCGHEYTLANLAFANTVEPHNTFITDKIKFLQTKKPTLPSTLADEKEMNPFLRCHIAAVIQSAEKYSGKKLKDPVEVFTVLREWKNKF